MGGRSGWKGIAARFFSVVLDFPVHQVLEAKAGIPHHSVDDAASVVLPVLVALEG
jgi:hypothetical protein